MTVQEFMAQSSFVEGQFVYLDDDKESTWEGAYVRDVFDDHIVVVSKLQQYKHTFDLEREDCKIDVPTINGKRVMAKKNIFGKYTCFPCKR